jgi:hypothetical protein
VHARTVHWRPAGPGERRCTATTLPGTRCRHWAQACTDPPLCWLHGHPGRHGQLRHGYYRRTPYLPDTLWATVLQLAAEGEPLAAEIAVMRLKIVALLAYLQRPQLPLRRSLPAYRLVFQALRTVATLLRAQQGLGYDAAGRVPLFVHDDMSETTGGYLPALLEQLALHHDR